MSDNIYFKDWSFKNVKPYYVVGAVLPSNLYCGWSVITSVKDSGWVEVLTDFGNILNIGKIETLYEEGIYPTTIQNFSGMILECGEVESLSERFTRHKENILQAEVILKGRGLL